MTATGADIDAISEDKDQYDEMMESLRKVQHDPDYQMMLWASEPHTEVYFIIIPWSKSESHLLFL